MATVSDRTLPEAVTGTPTAVRGYTADIVTASDYYPFGMVSRAFNSPSVSYRYGFNGKEVDNEMFGVGNELDYGMRVYDPRVGRFLSVDPLTKSYPWYTPYQFAGNRPINSIDLDGAEELEIHRMNLLRHQAQLQVPVRTAPTIGPAPPKTWAQKWKDSENILMNISYDVANGLYTLPQQLTASARQADYIHNIGGTAHRSHGIEDQTKRIDNGINGLTAYVPSAGAEKAGVKVLDGILNSKFTSKILAGIERKVIQQVPKLTKLETKIVDEANVILNSKEFDLIQKAYQSGTETSVKIGERIVAYNPETAGSSITMHASPFHEGSGFQLGPKAFESTTELKKTLIQELFRLNTQNTLELGVDVTRKYTDDAFQAGEKLHNQVNKQ